MLEIVTDEARTGEVSAVEARYAAGTEAETCPVCNGRGMRVGYVCYAGEMLERCNHCDGTGRVPDNGPHNAPKSSRRDEEQPKHKKP